MIKNLSCLLQQLNTDNIYIMGRGKQEGVQQSYGVRQPEMKFGSSSKKSMLGFIPYVRGAFEAFVGFTLLTEPGALHDGYVRLAWWGATPTVPLVHGTTISIISSQ